MRKLAFLVAIISISFSACRFGFGKRVRGDGHVVTSNRNLGSFTGVEQKGSFDIILKSGPVAEVVIEAEENISSHIDTYIDNNSLIIRTQEGFRLKPTRDIKIVVTAPVFSKVWSNGSGNITGENTLVDSSGISIGTSGSGNVTLQVQSPEVKAESYGSGNIELSGETRDLSMQSAGSGNLTADNLKSETASIEINGSGNATANASKTLDVTVRGSGDVGYKGSPAIKSDIKGSGNLNKMD